MRKGTDVIASHHIVSIMAGERHRDLVRDRGRSRASAPAPAATELRTPAEEVPAPPVRGGRRLVLDRAAGRLHASLGDEPAAALRARARRERRSDGEVADAALREYVSH